MRSRLRPRANERAELGLRPRRRLPARAGRPAPADERVLRHMPHERRHVLAAVARWVLDLRANLAKWGAPRIHGELLKLGFEVAQSSVAKYMAKRCGPSSQGWLTFLRNHSPNIAAMDLFVVPTIGFDLLYVLVIVRLARRDLVLINVTPNPTAEWIARQITEAFTWREAPRYLIRDTGSTVPLSRTDCGPWASVTNLLPQARLGRTVSPRD